MPARDPQLDDAVLVTARELFAARQFSGVVAACADALDEAPEHVELLLLRARAWIALRRELEAQADLRDVMRIAPKCGAAYRLLGQLAARRDEHEAAAIFFREALRLDPDDRDAADWLAVVVRTSRPAAAANKLPASSAAAGRVPKALPARSRLGSQPPPTPASVSAPVAAPSRRRARSVAPPEIPGLGEYLVEIGVLTIDRLRAAQTYQRSMSVPLATAVVTLGLASPQRVEWAAVAFQASQPR